MTSGEAPAAEERWTLDFAGRRQVLAPGELIIGRSPEPDPGAGRLPVADGTVSRHHARLRLVDGLLTLADLGSSNGTFVNGRRLDGEVELAPGDRLRLGRVRMVVGRGDASSVAGSPVAGQRLGSGLRRFCPNCGHRVASGDDACPQCGEDLRHERPLSRSEAIAMSEVMPVGEALALPPRDRDAAYPLPWGDGDSPPGGDETTASPRPLGRHEDRAARRGEDPLDDTDGGGLDTRAFDEIEELEAQAALAVAEEVESGEPRPLFLPAAGFLRRTGAALVDGALVAAAGGAGVAVAAFASGDVSAVDLAWAGLVAAVAAWLAVSVLGWWRWGTTPGKRLLRLWVCDLDGRPAISLGRALVRFLGYALSLGSFGYGYLRSGMAADGRALHDLLAGTYVAHPTPDVSLAGGRGGRRFRRSEHERRKLPV